MVFASREAMLVLVSRYAGSLHFEYMSSAGIGGHMFITYPQCTGTGKEHFVRQHKVLLAVSPTEKFRKKVAIKSF